MNCTNITVTAVHVYDSSQNYSQLALVSSVRKVATEAHMLQDSIASLSYQATCDTNLAWLQQRSQCFLLLDSQEATVGHVYCSSEGVLSISLQIAWPKVGIAHATCKCHRVTHLANVSHSLAAEGRVLLQGQCSAI
eukprot:5514543-Amphidinium_carterae.1